MPLNLTKEELGKKVIELNPDIVAFTATIITINATLEAARYLREILPKKTIFVIGGPQFTSLPERTMQKNDFDFGILGEGEYTFLEFANAIETGNKNYADIKSLAWYDKGKLIINPRRHFIQNLDELPLPARELFPPLSEYTPCPGGYKRLPFAHMVTSRGCPYRCIFCDRSVFGNMFRARSAQNVIDEIEYLVKQYGVKEIKFYDDLFTFDKKRVHAICDEIIRRDIDITWSCSARVDSVDLELLKKMKQAGCWQMDFGLESGNQNILNIMKKGITLKQSEQAIRWTKKAGIRARAFIIIGMPGETKESIRDTINFVKKIPLDMVTFYALMVYPGNELYSIVQEKGGLLHEDFDHFSSLIDIKDPHLHYVPEGLTEDAIKMLIKQAYHEFYFRPSYLFRQAIQIRGLEDIKRDWQAFFTLLKIGG